MRLRILQGGPFDIGEKQAILDYCCGDVAMTADLLAVMGQEINLPAALERGRYSKAVARMEWHGIPVDVPLLRALQVNWPEFRATLIADVENEHRYGIYVLKGDKYSFSMDGFERLLELEGLADCWRRTTNGRPCLERDYLSQMASAYPRLLPLRALRKTLSNLRRLNPPVGSDGRNRSSIRPFAAKTSRNQPLTRDMVMCYPAWARSLMCAEPGHALLYVDLSSAEFGIAAALSRDQAMMADYTSGDPYLGLGKRMRLVPSHATKSTHGPQRERLKAVCLGTQYGMGALTLATRLGISRIDAEQLLRIHRLAYPGYWSYIEAIVETAQFERQLWTVLDWRLNEAHLQRANTLRNFPMQATCAEILRLACCLATERGMEVVAPFHDALLVHVPVNAVEASLQAARDCWAEASAALLGGFELRCDIRRNKAVFEHPYPFVDGRESAFFERAVSFCETKGDPLIVRALANRTILDPYSRLEKDNGPADRRPRIEHAQHLHPEDYARFAKLGVIVSMQPYHAIDDGRWAETILGPQQPSWHGAGVS
jgi:hypothetical protein